jgi:predicted RNA-binding protein associated with RNAse of E/G family
MKSNDPLPAIVGAATQVKINLHRYDGDTRVFNEDLVEDDGARLKTFSVVPEPMRLSLSQRFWNDGFIAVGQVVYSVAKVHFYNEYFSIMELFAESGQLLGFYCDICTPLEKADGEYSLIDLCLDLMVTPDGQARELDWDEFDDAIVSGWIPLELIEVATDTLHRLEEELSLGVFPQQYLK